LKVRDLGLPKRTTPKGEKMTRLRKSNCTGTGNDRCNVERDEMVRLNNIPIERIQIINFTKKLGLYGKTHVILSNRKTVARWGTCWTQTGRIILYRHSVWIFLHELAHIASKSPGHGSDFGDALDTLYLEWMDFAGFQA
jgi:predicted metal-dependent hydrolase